MKANRSQRLCSVSRQQRGKTRDKLNTFLPELFAHLTCEHYKEDVGDKVTNFDVDAATVHDDDVGRQHIDVRRREVSQETGYSTTIIMRPTQRAPLPWLCLVLVLLLLNVVCVQSQENRCICSLRDNRQLYTYDHEKLSLPLPCNYRLTSIKTRDGRCQITVDLAMTSREGKTTTPAGLRYLVTQDGYVTGGIINGRGVMSIGPRLRSSSPLSLPELTSSNGVSILAYQDEFQSYRLALTECKVTLYYKPGHFLGVYSHNYSSSYSYNLRDLCGDCDGTRNEVMTKLPPDMLGNIRSLKERDAAMLYMTSTHISGGAKKCHDYRQMISSCRKTTLLWAISVCGQLFDSSNRLVTCLSSRTSMGQVLDTYFHCVRMFCIGNSRMGCRYIHDLASSMYCSVPRQMGC